MHFPALVVSALLFALAPAAAIAQEDAALAPFIGEAAIVDFCEVPPDYFTGNCPPTVSEQFAALLALGTGPFDIDIQVANVAVALAERGQLAAAELDIPLCIDLAQGIIQVAQYSSDAEQRASIIELARFMCCVVIEGASYGLGYGATLELPLTGPANDGGVLNGATIFESAGASFISDDIRPGDLLVITSGEQQGFYLIAEVVSQTTLVLRQDETVAFPGWQSTEIALTFEIRRPEPGYEDAVCDPGFETAAIIPEDPPQASAN
ncbi:MAG: hypothetical protein WEB63_02830 [Cucumibacter sp.]